MEEMRGRGGSPSTCETSRDAAASSSRRTDDASLRVAVDLERAMVGSSRAMRELRARIARYAASDHPVLITGETGTGKDVAARVLHDAGPRASAPYVPVNAGALRGPLAADALFGHERGSFTGAQSSRAGALEEAGSGTLLLDEVGDLCLEVQPQLLRVLEERRFRRIGGHETLSFRARVLSATHRDVTDPAVLRSDLFQRLGVLVLRLPPLRERLEDVPELIECAQRSLPRALEMTKASMSILKAHRWPGNVRELFNFLARVAVETDDRLITPDTLVPLLLPATTSHERMPDGGPPSLADAVSQVPRALQMLPFHERQAQLRRALAKAGVSCARTPEEAAESLGLDPRTLRRHLKPVPR
jgi:two-component system, NtrC family, response regulator AtoC